MKKKFVVILVVILIINIFYYLTSQRHIQEPIPEDLGVGEEKKVLYVDSCHADYEPSIIMQRAARDILEPAGVEMQVIYMDAKRKKSDEMQQQAALRVRDFIESWKPDLVIAADDAASKYLVMPYYKDADLPFVFIGVNWDATPYRYPYKNATGQVEVELVQELLTELGKYARGNRIGMLSGDTLTDRKALGYYQDVLNIRFERAELVNDFNAWKEAYISLQDEVGILLVRNNSGIEGWNDQEAKSFVHENTYIPSGTVSTHLAPWVLISYSKVNQEFAEYAATSALQILNGESPADIPISTNKQAKVYLNMRLASRLGIEFPMELVERATFAE